MIVPGARGHRLEIKRTFRAVNDFVKVFSILHYGFSDLGSNERRNIRNEWRGIELDPDSSKYVHKGLINLV